MLNGMDFPLSNSLSPIELDTGQSAVFCLYVDKLIKELRNSGLGCKIGGQYVGVTVYADDIFMLSAS